MRLVPKTFQKWAKRRTVNQYAWIVNHQEREREGERRKACRSATDGWNESGRFERRLHFGGGISEGLSYADCDAERGHCEAVDEGLDREGCHLKVLSLSQKRL